MTEAMMAAIDMAWVNLNARVCVDWGNTTRCLSLNKHNNVATTNTPALAMSGNIISLNNAGAAVASMADMSSNEDKFANSAPAPATATNRGVSFAW